MLRPGEAGGRPGVQIGVCVREVQGRLGAGGIEDAGREARRLVCAIAGVAPEALIMRPETVLAEDVVGAVETAIGKRLAGMTIGRIVGEQSFYGRSFALNDATLEPRADSETVVDAVLEVLGEAGRAGAPLRIIDVGTGTGCLLISLLAELPSATGIGIDLSARALQAAQQNAVRHGVDGRVMFVVADGLEGVQGPCDVLISNPPYIRAGDIAGLDETVRCHDPVLALDGGADGLDVYRKIAERAGAVAPDGWLFLEIGAGMRESVCQVFDARFGTRGCWRVWQDFNGHERCVACKPRTGPVSE